MPLGYSQPLGHNPPALGRGSEQGGQETGSSRLPTPAARRPHSSQSTVPSSGVGFGEALNQARKGDGEANPITCLPSLVASIIPESRDIDLELVPNICPQPPLDLSPSLVTNSVKMNT